MDDESVSVAGIKQWLADHELEEVTNNTSPVYFKSSDIPVKPLIKGSYSYVGGPSPLNFYVIRNCDTVVLKHLKKQLKLYYSPPYNQTDYAPTKGDIVVLLKRHARGEILNVFDAEDIRVRLIDHAEIITTNISNIAPILHYRFIRIPALVYNVRLFGVACPDEHSEKCIQCFKAKMSESSSLKILPYDKKDDMWEVRAKLGTRDLAEELHHCGLITDISPPTVDLNYSGSSENSGSLDALILGIENISCSDSQYIDGSKLAETLHFCHEASSDWETAPYEHRHIFVAAVKQILAEYNKPKPTYPVIGGLQNCLDEIRAYNCNFMGQRKIDKLSSLLTKYPPHELGDKELDKLCNTFLETACAYLSPHLHEFVQNELLGNLKKMHEYVISNIDRVRFPEKVEVTDIVKSVNNNIHEHINQGARSDQALRSTMKEEILPKFEAFLSQIYKQFEAALTEEFTQTVNTFDLSSITASEDVILSHLDEVEKKVDEYERMNSAMKDNVNRFCLQLEHILQYES